MEAYSHIVPKESYILMEAREEANLSDAIAECIDLSVRTTKTIILEFDGVSVPIKEDDEIQTLRNLYFNLRNPYIKALSDSRA